jgi:hypothetical protein
MDVRSPVYTSIHRWYYHCPWIESLHTNRGDVLYAKFRQVIRAAGQRFATFLGAGNSGPEVWYQVDTSAHN